LRTDEVADQLATRSRVGGFVQTANVRHCGEASVAGDGKPAATGAEVATAGDVPVIVPYVQSAGGAIVELIAVCGDDDRVLRRGMNGDGDQAHGQRRRCFCTLPSAVRG